MKPEEKFNGRKVALNLTMYKQLGFYQLLDPNGPKIYGYHIYSTVLKTFLIAVQFISIFGVLGFFIEMNDTVGADNKKTSSFEIIVILTNCTLSSLKMYTLLSNADVIWNMFDITCINFLQCVQNSEIITKKLVKRCVQSTIITSLIAYSFFGGMILWIMGPWFIANETHSDPLNNIVSRRHENIINIKFPVTVKIYNQYFFAFYIMEIAIGFCIVYGSILVDAFLMSFCWIISAQYQSVTSAYKAFGHDLKSLNSELDPILRLNKFERIINRQVEKNF